MQNATGNARSVELLETNRPQQQRAIRTFEGILVATGELLCEVGLERISTNNIAERAGVTVPALYRYFPNKYAVLNALGTRLVEAQREAFSRWHDEHVVDKPVGETLESLYALLYEIYLVTRDFPGGLEIMHGMQAMTPLQDVRLKSHWLIAEEFGRIWCKHHNTPLTPGTVRRMRIAVEMGLMLVQMALEDRRLQPERALRDGAEALRVYLDFTMGRAEHEVN